MTDNIPKKILVIDDDREIRNIIQEYLEERGFNIVLAETGQTGIEMARKVKPDLVILDVEMPDLEGYEVCRRLKAIRDLKHVPVIMLTGRTHENDELKGFKSGADDYVTKPFKGSRLLARVESAIERTAKSLEANPLTKLPGNVAILAEIERRIKNGGAYAVLYFDLNNFKAFNDAYGFVKGDEAIHLLSDILDETFEEEKTRGGFVGHIGGDDFVGCLDSHDVRDVCISIVKDFDKKIVTLYSDKDKKRGKMTSIDRHGKPSDFPIMGLAIAVVTNKLKVFHHPGEIALIAGELKKWAKNFDKSTFVIDRRS